ncbi:unnamed protein product [Vitrella brassicaformis CCMP3155]|uniref:AB hydrolase-1 domain-containing protein n=2 Tax=Vitrella brassicaformis TaxID=1169539 RepID=A0A0G4EQ52_VITBC|nr:unnamed protein product [Vitrella brassicaformis CCMP3155]|eukprot:CEL99532.1 unnamed protein product [Vitrella brassicaformis CCMP3155]
MRQLIFALFLTAVMSQASAFQPQPQHLPLRHQRIELQRQSRLRAARQPGVLTKEREAVDLHYIDIPANGHDSREAVLLLHGLLGSSRNWMTWAKRLSSELDTSRRIIVPDLRNHGSSTHAESMTYAEMAQDVLRLLESVNEDRIVCVGHSMGGKVAAALGLLEPSRVDGLVIVDVAPVPYSTEDGNDWKEIRRIINGLQALPLHALSTRQDADRGLRDEHGIDDDALRAFVLTNLERHEDSWRWRINLDAIARSLEDLALFDLEAAWGSESELPPPYEGDTLFVMGSNSRYIQSRHLDVIQRLFASFTLQTVKEAGHWVHADQPDRMVQVVKAYLDR